MIERPLLSIKYFASKLLTQWIWIQNQSPWQECHKHLEWDKWKAAIGVVLRSLYEREVFGQTIPSPPNVIPEGCRWVFLLKRNMAQSEASGTRVPAETRHQL
jgi:hypothetical protein